MFKWGYANTTSAYFDYRQAHSNILPWFASPENINLATTVKGILEFPICAEPVNLLGMLSMKRLVKALRYLREDSAIGRETRRSAGKTESLQKNRLHGIFNLFRTYPKKFDFCKLTAKEMVQMIKKINKQHNEGRSYLVPIVMIGHSKELDSCVPLDTFLKIACNILGDSLQFYTYRQAIAEFYQSKQG